MIRDPSHSGTVTNGKFIPDNAEMFKADFENFEGMRVEVSLKEHKRKDEFNRFYWAVINKGFVDFFNKEKSFGKIVKPEFVHEILCAKFVGYMKQMLPGGEIIEMRIPTRTMTTKEFYDFVQYSREWGESFFNISFPEREEGKA